MSAALRGRRGPGRASSSACWCWPAVLVFVGANAHLVYVAVTSQPDCVDHVRQGEAGNGTFRAAKSACSPRSPIMTSSIPAVVPPLRPDSAYKRGLPAAAAFELAGGGMARPRGAAGTSLAYGFGVFIVSVVIVAGLFASAGLHPVSGLRRLHGRRTDPRHRPLREEPAASPPARRRASPA